MRESNKRPLRKPHWFLKRAEMHGIRKRNGYHLEAQMARVRFRHLRLDRVSDYRMEG
jgi:hypothetical protein